jgi:hypothetical protein
VRRVSCRVGRTVRFPARVESTPVTPVVVLLHCLQPAERGHAGPVRRRRLASGRSPGRRVLGSSGSTAVCEGGLSFPLPLRAPLARRYVRAAVRGGCCHLCSVPDARRERCCVSSPRRSRCRDHLAVARRPPRQSSLPTYGTPSGTWQIRRQGRCYS